MGKKKITLYDEFLGFEKSLKLLTPRNQFLVIGLIKDMIRLNEVPNDLIPFLLKERCQIK